MKYLQEKKKKIFFDLKFLLEKNLSHFLLMATKELKT